MIENNPQKYIGAAFDSINLINNTILKVINEKNISIVKRNVQFLEIMLEKEWFFKELTRSQLRKINDCIKNGNSFISTN